MDVAGAASATRVNRVRRRWAAITQAPEQACCIELVELMVVQRIEASEKTLADQQRQKRLKKLCIVRRSEAKPLA